MPKRSAACSLCQADTCGLPPGIEHVARADGSRAYRGRYRGPDRRKASTAVYPTIALAQRALDEARGDVARGDYIDPRRSAVTLDWWMQEWMPDRPKVRPYVLEKDWTRYRIHIKPHLGNLPLSEITALRVQTWMGRLADKGVRPPTIKKAHELLRTALGKRGAMGDGRIRVNPCELVQSPTVERPEWQLVTREQFDRLLTEIPKHYRPLVLTAAFTGLRWSELAGLHRHHYNPLKGTLTVEQGRVYHAGRMIDGPTKNRKTRTVPLMPGITEALNALLAAQPIDGGPIFRSIHGKLLRHPYFDGRVYKPAAVRAGLGQYVKIDGQDRWQGVRFHDLRHSCLSWLLNGGMDIHEVKDWAGHSSITTTQLYAHTDADEMRAAMLKAFGDG
jgi:integrase